MSKISGWLLAAALLAGAAIGIYFWQQWQSQAPKPQPMIEEPPPAAVKPEPPAHYPILENLGAPLKPEALPALDQSDLAIWKALSGLYGEPLLKNLLRPQDMVRHVVVTIDNLPRKTVAARLLPTKPVAGGFRITGQAGNLAISPENAARYTPYVRLAEMVDARDIVALYVRFYPLFQSAYQDLGYPEGYFNDRLVAVIDHLLAAPQEQAPLMLVQPHVLYQFADPELEEQSAGRKILLRMGEENATRIKAKLRQIRAELTSAQSKPPAQGGGAR
ncbi:MAG TPA: DUF3014 domain-containing protein [Burkholderiaceae bacterium]|nr:DUF3014 domain-containing protein [Burkholderiaceae bacterium]